MDLGGGMRIPGADDCLLFLRQAGGWGKQAARRGAGYLIRAAARANAPDNAAARTDTPRAGIPRGDWSAIHDAGGLREVIESLPPRKRRDF